MSIEDKERIFLNKISEKITKTNFNTLNENPTFHSNRNGISLQNCTQ